MATLTPFQRAFAQARRDRERVFEFPKGSGKMYTTETAEEKASRTPPAAPVPSDQDMRARGRRAQESVVRVPPPPPEFTPQAERAAQAKAAARKRSEDFDAQLAEQRREEARQERMMRPGSQAIEPIAPELMLAGPAALASRARAARALIDRETINAARAADAIPDFKKGGKVKSYAKGGSVRGDGIAQRGKTRGRMV